MAADRPSNRGERRRLRTRAALLAAAREVFGSQGVDASGNPTWATIRPIAVGDDGVLEVTRDLRLRP